MGLVISTRNGQTRIYSFENYVRLLIVLQGHRSGYSLAEIRELLQTHDLKDSDIRGDLLIARSKFMEQIAILLQRQSDIDESIKLLSKYVRQDRRHVQWKLGHAAA